MIAHSLTGYPDCFSTKGELLPKTTLRKKVEPKLKPILSHDRYILEVKETKVKV